MKIKYLLFTLLLAAISPCALKAQTNSCVIDSFPWTENFNSYGNGSFLPQIGPCWAYACLNNTNREFRIENGALYLPHGGGGLNNGTYATLTLPPLLLPSENYTFSMDVYRESDTQGYIEVFATPDGNIGNLDPVGYIYTDYSFNSAYWDTHDHGMVPPENGPGWYNYSFNIPYSGSCYIVLRCMSDWSGQGYTPKNLYMDNFCVSEVPTGLAVSNITSSSADISWTPATDETVWIVQYGVQNAFYSGSFQQVTVTGNPSVTLTNLDNMLRYHVRVKAVNGSVNSGWSYSASFEMTPRYIVGKTGGWHRMVPFCGTNAYDYTQQIYTADELGDASTIKSIEFYKSDLIPCKRNLDVYIVHTDKASFENTNEWISVTSANRVFSGPVYFSMNDWTVIKLQTPFEYDGQSNVAIIIDDNTGSAQQYSYFNAYQTSTSQACVSTNHQNSVGPSSPGEGYLLNRKNNIRLIKDYPIPSDLHCTAITTTSATVDWTENGESDTWQICINDDESNLITVTSNNKPYTLTGLTPDTQYSVKVRSLHENGLYSSWSYSFNFGTATSLPYSTDFETDCSWALVNGILTNQWYWGTAAHHDEGSHGLYISNDGGTTNAYSNSKSAMVYAYKTLSFEAGNYEIFYDWLANGEKSYDFLRVALVPASVVLEASTITPEDFEYNTLPEGWMALDGGAQLSKVTEWQTARYEFSVPTAGYYNLVFAWCNDHTIGTNPPAAIDNVSIEVNTCLRPDNLTAGNIGTTSADLSWGGWPEVESYTVHYLNTGIIFTEDFESDIDDWTLRNCANATGIFQYSGHSGNAMFQFEYNTNPPQYLISPELAVVAEGMKLEFYYKNVSTNYPETFQVGFSATDSATESFTFGDEITASDAQWHLYSATIPFGTKYICWKHNSYDQNRLDIDDIVVCTGAPAGEWQTASVAGNATEVSTTLTGLTSGFQYEAFVYPDCDPDKVSETVYFTTEAVLPFYATSFENGCDWTLVNGDLTNQWTWGTAAYNGEGTHGLYISNNGGINNFYSIYSPTMVYAYKTFNFEADIYNFSYDWKAIGEGNYDFLRVALVPATVNLEASTSILSGFNHSVLPEGWIALDGGSQLNLANDWQTVSLDVEIATAGEYLMVFAWRNDNAEGDNPPAAIDNVSIEVVTCPTPANLTVSNLTATTADLGWTASMPTDSYTVKYRTAQTVNAVFTEGFENGIDDWTLRNCADYTGISTMATHSGGVGFYFMYNTNPPQYLISPELTGISEGMKLEFYYRNHDSDYPETFQVGFSTTDNETESFTFGDEITASDMEWYLYSETIPEGTRYICWKLNSYDQEFLFIDDIMVGTEVPTGAWQTATVAGNATEVSATLTGLTPSTPYEAFVYPDCNPDKVSDIITFTTLEQTTVTQTIALAAGTNWVSFNVEITIDDLKAALVAASPGNTITIKSQTQKTTYNPNNGRWTGRLTALDVTQMYKITVSTACEITLEAMPVDIANHVITITPGANYIAYPLNTSKTPQEVFSGFAIAGDMVKSQTQKKQYNANGRWTGQLSNLEPGHGYVYVSNSTETRTFTFPTGE
jgi:hypothetical protein